jgi:hypothetical protein
MRLKDWSSYRWGEAAVAAALKSLGLYMAVAAAQMPGGSVAQPGPAVLPFALGILLMVVGGAIVVGLGLRSAAPTAAPMGREGAIAIASLAVAAGAFEHAGALATFAALLALLHFTLKRGALWKSALFGVAGSAAAWAFFVHLLGVGLPGPGF